jgi:thiamine-phosphate pyrophosphorylase
VSAALYLVTPPALPDLGAFESALTEALDAGLGTAAEVACVQLRLKGVGDDEVLRAAERLLPLCRDRGTGFLLNDRADLAKRAGADGVHIGQRDGTVAEARKVLGPDANVGVTCHGSMHLAIEAGEAGADYVAFGAFFPSETKAVEHHADPEVLTAWSMMTVVPCVAIGGITAANARPLVEAGADYLAVSAAVWRHPDGPAAGVRSFAPVLKR